MCELFTDDGRLIDVELEVLPGGGCLDDPIYGSAFIVDSTNQFIDEYGNSKQILGERSTLPICLRSEFGQESAADQDELRKIVNQIFKATYKSEIRQQFLDRLKHEWLDKIILLVSIVIGSFVLMFGMGKIFGG
jgi:hypothetical protein